MSINNPPSLFGNVINGLAPASGGGTANFLRADGSWDAPPGDAIPVFDAVTDGLAPLSGGGTAHYLRADGNWITPPNTTYAVFTSVANGLAPLSGGGTANFLRADGSWAVPPGTGGGGLVAWTTVASWDFAVTGAVAEVDSSALAGYTEVLIQCNDVTCSGAAQRAVQVSVNNGVSYFVASTDYDEEAATGVATQTFAHFLHTTPTASARSCGCHIYNIAEKLKMAHLITRGIMGRFIASATALTNVRVVPMITGAPSGTFNGGTILIFAR